MKKLEEYINTTHEVISYDLYVAVGKSTGGRYISSFVVVKDDTIIGESAEFCVDISKVASCSQAILCSFAAYCNNADLVTVHLSTSFPWWLLQKSISLCDQAEGVEFVFQSSKWYNMNEFNERALSLLGVKQKHN